MKTMRSSSSDRVTLVESPEVKSLARDTDRAAQAVQIEILRAMPAWRKLELLADCCESNRALLEAGLRSRFPEATDLEVRHMLVELMIGKRAAARIRHAPTATP
jgi:hypothetical protein